VRDANASPLNHVEDTGTKDIKCPYHCLALQYLNVYDKGNISELGNFFVTLDHLVTESWALLRRVLHTAAGFTHPVPIRLAVKGLGHVM
jgi:hypothetical protein